MHSSPVAVISASSQRMVIQHGDGSLSTSVGVSSPIPSPTV